MSRIEVFTQAWCPYCARVVALLHAKNVTFQEIDAPHGSAERQGATGRSGRSTMPQVFIDGKFVGGCDDVVALDRTGKLDTLLEAA